VRLIDTHSHIYDTQFDEDRDAVVTRACGVGVERLYLPAIDEESYEAMFALTRKYPDLCRPMMGLHPTSVNDNPGWREALERVADYLATPPEGIRFYGVGEVGLDFYWSRDWMDEQFEALRFQIELALRYDLPLVVHTRDAWDEMCRLMQEYAGSGLRGIMHSFCGSIDHYRALKASGDFLFGVGGPVTYKRSTLPDTLREIPLTELVLETDSPYLPPVPYRGKRNESAYVELVARKLAEIYETTPEEVGEITTRNALKLFGELK